MTCVSSRKLFPVLRDLLGVREQNIRKLVITLEQDEAAVVEMEVFLNPPSGGVELKRYELHELPEAAEVKSE